MRPTEKEQLIKIHDLTFKPFISAEAIHQKTKELGKQLSADYQNKNPLFIAILNGSFIFAADLVRACHFDSDITFIKLSSYNGTGSSGKVETLIGLTEEIEGRDIIIIEDIVDTGNTLNKFLQTIHKQNPASVALVSLLLKPEVFKNQFQIDYLGFEIPNKFVIGYGLDYNGRGRTFGGIYQLHED